MAFPFVPVGAFAPNTAFWSRIGNINSVTAEPDNTKFTFKFGKRSLFIQVLGPRSFRMRFNPAEGAGYSGESSVAVVTRDLGVSKLIIKATQTSTQQTIDTGTIRIVVDLKPFAVSVFRGNQLIHRDSPGEGVLYIPNQEVTAVIKSAPNGAKYTGCGEKAGRNLLKNGFSYTFFNFDNFQYTGNAVGTGGPLNPTVPLYCSIPVLVESNPFPSGEFAGAPFASAVFLDNVAQSYINVSANFPAGTDMTNKYYVGSLYNDLDYYYFAGDGIADVLAQYTTLTGRAPMPPRYAFGLHQGAYGYYDRYKLSLAANSYRAARIPCDGLHIDVDFQDNYRTFTHSELKFPNAAELFKDLHTIGFKMSTNITPILKAPTGKISLDETGKPSVYEQRENIRKVNGLIFDTRFNQGTSPDFYEGGVFYGVNMGSNPYSTAYPPLTPNRENQIPLKAPGNYPDLGLSNVRDSWGEQYEHLLNDLDLDMIWQDMTCVAMDENLPPSQEEDKTFPQDLMMAQEVTNPATGAVTVRYLPNAKLHNVYALNLLRATWEGIGKLRTNRRNFIIARGGYAGMQRYAALWTGDSNSTWDFLRINIPEVLNLGMSGVPISGCDIGGFANSPSNGIDTSFPDTSLYGTPFVNGQIMGGVTNYELLTRWMQVGSFLPWYRNHYNGYTKQFQEPYAYAEPVPTNCRKYVELRYRMMQVYYDAMFKWTQTGVPIARALFLNDPQDPEVYNHVDDQFFVGDDFLVAPIIDPHDSLTPPTLPVRDVYLPRGSDWYAFMDNKAPVTAAVPGGTTIRGYIAGLDLVPIYVRAGAILPFSELEQWVGQVPENPVTFNCYPGPDRWTPDSAYQLYQDDGISTDSFVKGNYRLTRIYQRTQSSGGNVVREIRVERVVNNYSPYPYYFIAILGSLTPPKRVGGGSYINVGDPVSLSMSVVNSYYWNASIQVTFAKVFDNLVNNTIPFEF